MDFGEKMILGVNTTIIAMGIVFAVLILLAVMIIIQSKILRVISSFSTGEEKKEEPAGFTPAVVETPRAAFLDKGGKTAGEAKLLGVDEEHIPVIMAAVSNVSNIPLTSLRIRSIRKVDDNWERTSKQEQSNQRL
jgi:Na+-transporting methylmalonyl-CoA/oxaloacetate decarboxylase gamma subunit